MRHIDDIDDPTWHDLFDREAEIRRLKQEIEEIRSDIGEVYMRGVSAGREAERIAERGHAVEFLHMRAEEIRKGEREPANRESALIDAAEDLRKGKHR